MALQSTAPLAFVITHVTVIDVVHGTEQKNQTVLLRGDRIVSIAAAVAADTNVAGAVDAHGGFLIPGLWDMHVHVLDLEDLPLYVANGVIGVRMMFGSVDTRDLRAQLAQAPISPEIIVGSAIVDGDPPVWQHSIVVKHVDEARRAVDSIKAGGADFVKIYNGVPRDAYYALADEAKEQGIPFVGHLPNGVTAQEASAAGQKSIEHLDGIPIACSRVEQKLTRSLQGSHYVERMNVVAAAYRTFDGAQCATFFTELRNNQTWQVPTLTVLRSHGLLNDRTFTEDKRLAYMSKDVSFRWQPQNDARFRRWTPEMYAFARGLFKLDERMVSMMCKAGVPLMASTDAMNPFCLPGFSLHDELGLLVEAGLTPLAALQTATVNPAKFLGRETEMGNVVVGQAADLVLLDADPLVDVRNTMRIQAVWLKGRYFDRAALDQMLESAKHRTGEHGVKIKGGYAGETEMQREPRFVGRRR